MDSFEQNLSGDKDPEPEMLPTFHPYRVARRKKIRKVIESVQRCSSADFQPSTPLKKAGLTHNFP